MLDIISDNDGRTLIYDGDHIPYSGRWERILVEYEAKRILVNAGIVVGILVVGFLAFFGILKVFSVMANIPFP